VFAFRFTKGVTLLPLVDGRYSRKFKVSGLAAYSSSKGAVITLSELLAEEYKEQGIAFNVLALGSANRNARRSFSGLPSTYFG
jgi:NAD(P)-dependent dehydrogenase (short-subunit alcohol dehydrogenase family)